MKALQFRRNLPRYAAARLAGSLTPGGGAGVGPLRLADLDPPAPPGPDWVRVLPRLSGICGSDLATIDGRSARYFEPLVSFPFVPGHEVVGDREDGTRVVLEPVLGCVSRNLAPTCRSCADGRLGNCEHTTFGDLEPGIQTGSCHDTGGGWATAFSAHSSQLHPVDDALDDEAAVMVEPTACAVHAALLADIPDDAVVTVLGSGTLGLLTIAAVRAFAAPRTIVATAKYPAQRRLAAELLEANPADVVLDLPEGEGAGAFTVAGSPSVRLDWGDVAAEADRRDATLAAEVDFQPENATFPFGVHASVVEVDAEIGRVTVLRHVCCDDAGVIVNPTVVDGQVHGGVAGGIAHALMEEFRYADDGTPLTGNFMDYGIPSAAEFPSFERIEQVTATTLNPLGVKGIGEAGTIGATPAVQNAVVDALAHLGVRHVELPVTAQRVYQAIADAPGHDPRG